MKAFIVSLMALTLAGCSALPTISYPPSATPVATVTLSPQVQAIITMICSSPAATADPKVAAGCLVLPLLTAPVVK